MIVRSERQADWSLHYVTLRMKTERWQEDLLMKRMNLCRSIYNAGLDEGQRRLSRLRRDARYERVREEIAQVYARREVERRALKEGAAWRALRQEQEALWRRYGLTAYSMKMWAVEASRAYAGVLPSRVAHFTIGVPLWQVFHALLTDRRRGVCYKREGEVRALISDGRSGIRLIGAQGTALREGIDLRADPQPLQVIYGRSKGRRILRAPLLVDTRDATLLDALTQPIRTVSILRVEAPRASDTRPRYIVQLTLREAGEEPGSCAPGADAPDRG